MIFVIYFTILDKLKFLIISMPKLKTVIITTQVNTLYHSLRLSSLVICYVLSYISKSQFLSERYVDSLWGVFTNHGKFIFL